MKLFCLLAVLITSSIPGVVGVSHDISNVEPEEESVHSLLSFSNYGKSVVHRREHPKLKIRSEEPIPLRIFTSDVGLDEPKGNVQLRTRFINSRKSGRGVRKVKNQKKKRYLIHSNQPKTRKKTKIKFKILDITPDKKPSPDDGKLTFNIKNHHINSTYPETIKKTTTKNSSESGNQRTRDFGNPKNQMEKETSTLAPQTKPKKDRTGLFDDVVGEINQISKIDQLLPLGQRLKIPGFITSKNKTVSLPLSSAITALQKLAKKSPKFGVYDSQGGYVYAPSYKTPVQFSKPIQVNFAYLEGPNKTRTGFSAIDDAVPCGKHCTTSKHHQQKKT